MDDYFLKPANPETYKLNRLMVVVDSRQEHPCVNDIMVPQNLNVYTEHDNKGKVRWGFNLPLSHKGSCNIASESLPSVHFRFDGASKTPAPPPTCMEIAVISFWSSGPTKPKHNWIRKFMHLFKLTRTVVSYTNLVKIVVLDVHLSELSKKSYYYAAKMEVRSGICGPPKVISAANPINVTSAVTDGKYIYLLSCGLGI